MSSKFHQIASIRLVTTIRYRAGKCQGASLLTDCLAKQSVLSLHHSRSSCCRGAAWAVRKDPSRGHAHGTTSPHNHLQATAGGGFTALQRESLPRYRRPGRRPGGLGSLAVKMAIKKYHSNVCMCVWSDSQRLTCHPALNSRRCQGPARRPQHSPAAPAAGFPDSARPPFLRVHCDASAMKGPVRRAAPSTRPAGGAGAGRRCAPPGTIRRGGGRPDAALGSRFRGRRTRRAAMQPQRRRGRLASAGRRTRSGGPRDG